MVATICKAFTFPAAHQLPNHEGPCARPHGHTYKLEVIVTGRIQELDGGSAEGMVMDFADLTMVYDTYVAPRVDHRDLNEWLSVPTSERIALAIHTIYKAHLGGDDLSGPWVCVRLWESPTSYAEVGKAPWRG